MLGKRAQKVKALAAKLSNLSSVPGTHKVQGCQQISTHMAVRYLHPDMYTKHMYI